MTSRLDSNIFNGCIDISMYLLSITKGPIILMHTSNTQINLTLIIIDTLVIF